MINTIYSYHELRVHDSIVTEKLINCKDDNRLLTVKFNAQKDYSDSLEVLNTRNNDMAGNCEKNCKKQIAGMKTWSAIKSGIIYAETTALVILGMYVYTVR